MRHHPCTFAFRHWTRAASTLAILISALTTSAVVASEGVAAAAQPGWSVPEHVAPGQYLASVSCPTSSFCLAVGSGYDSSSVGNGTFGVALTWDGSRWSSSREVDGYGGLTSVACRSASSCVAVDLSGYAVAWDGRNWSRPQFVARGYLSGVSCPASGPCVTTDGLTGTAYALSGGTWTRDGQPDRHRGQSLQVSCPRGGYCMVVGGDGTSATGAGTWSPAGGPGPELVGVSCPVPRWCAVVGRTAANSPGYVGVTSDGQWENTTVRGFVPSAVSCASTTFCVATGRSRAVIWDGRSRSWSQPQVVDPTNTGLTAISCPAASSCLAVDAAGNVMDWRS